MNVMKMKSFMMLLVLCVGCACGADVAFAVGTEATPSGTVSIFQYSQNTGPQTWLQHGLGSGTATCLTCVTARMCWVAGWSGFMERTTDGANTWVEQDTRTTQRFTGIAAVSETVVWAVTAEGGVFVTNNGGATWSSRSVDPSKGKQDIYFRSNLRGWIVGNAGDTWRTVDGGATWEFHNAGRSETLYGVHFLNQNVGYAVGTNGAILKTTNGAAAAASDVTWTVLNAGTTMALQSVFVTPDRTVHIVGWGQEYFRSADEGATWTTVSLPVNTYHYSVAFLDNNNGWASGGQGKIHVTTNGGASWTETCCSDVSGVVRVTVARKPPVEAGCANPTAQLLLAADSLPSSGTARGFFNSVSKSVCTSSAGPLYLSGDTTVDGAMSSLDDMLVYQIATNRVVGLSYSGTCAASGFLSIAESSVQQVGSRTSGPAVSLGVISANQFTLKVGVNDCGGAAANGPIYLVGCSLIDCQSSSSTTSPGSSSGSSSSSGTVWSGQYEVTTACGSGCCCVSGTFSLTQSGTQVTGTLSLSGSCGGQTSAPISVTLASASSTSVTATVLGQRMDIVKDGVTVTLSNCDAPQCSGAADCTSGDCRSSSATSNAGGGNVCFHESTVIEYEGQRYTMQELVNGKAAHQCHVPHTVTASEGVIIETDCTSSSSSSLSLPPLHLTADHLVYTLRGGLKPAHAVAVGEVLFADLQQTKRCTVTKMTTSKKSATPERYFGLNCVRSSQVLANGIKTSTFGHYHAVPAAWMRVVGQCFGIERASRWGNALAHWWHGA